MNLSGKDMRHLMYMERWATYSMATGALSLEEVMLKDNGQTFSSIVRNEDMVVQSFNMKELPVLCIWQSATPIMTKHLTATAPAYIGIWS